VKISSSDIFSNFFSSVIESIKNEDYSTWKESLKLDAEVLNMTKQSINGK